MDWRVMDRSGERGQARDRNGVERHGRNGAEGTG